MTTIKNSIIFVLTKELKVYRLDNVNSPELILEAWDNIYEHSDKIFEKLENYLAISLQIYIIIQPTASYTNTRTLYLWLKTRLYLTTLKNPGSDPKTSLQIAKVDSVFEFINRWKSQPDLLNSLTWQENLLYSSAPRIGIKKK